MHEPLAHDPLQGQDPLCQGFSFSLSSLPKWTIRPTMGVLSPSPSLYPYLCHFPNLSLSLSLLPSLSQYLRLSSPCSLPLALVCHKLVWYVTMCWYLILYRTGSWLVQLPIMVPWTLIIILLVDLVFCEWGNTNMKQYGKSHWHNMENFVFIEAHHVWVRISQSNSIFKQGIYNLFRDKLVVTIAFLL